MRRSEEKSDAVFDVEEAVFDEELIERASSRVQWVQRGNLLRNERHELLVAHAGPVGVHFRLRER